MSQLTGHQFLRVLTGGSFEDGSRLASVTQDITVISSVVKDRPCVLVDTPGFDDTVKSEAEILRLIADFLAATYVALSLGGVTVLNEITQIRRRQEAERHHLRPPYL